MLQRYLLLLVTVALAVGACGKQAAPSPSAVVPPPDLRLTFAGSRGANTLDPALASDPASIAVCSLVYQTLVRMNRRLQVVPAAASSWLEFDHGLEYVFYLRPNLRFSTGARVTAADVVGSLRRAMSLGQASGGLGGYLSEVRSVESIPSVTGAGPGIVEFNLSYPSPAFLSKLTFVSASIVDMATVKRYWPVWTVHADGSGPFRLALWQPYGTVKLAPNPYYLPTPPKTHVTITFQSPSAALTSFLNNTTDVVAGLPSPISLPPAIRKYARYVAQPPALDYVVVNTRQRPLTNPTLRQALALSVNRTSLVKDVLGTSAMPTGALVPPSILPGAFQQQFDPETALRLLVRAHLAPPPLPGGGTTSPTLPANVRPLRLLYLNTTTETRKAQFLQQLWEKYLGVQVHPIGEDYPGYVTALRTGHFDLALVQWGAQYLDASNFLNFQLRGGAPENLSGWNDPSFNRIMKASLVQGIDSRSRHADLLMAALIAAQQAPWIALDEPLQLTLVHTSAGAVALTPAGWAGFAPGT